MNSLSIREAFPLRLKHYMNETGKTRNDLVRDLGFKYTTIRDWEKGLTVPRMDKVELLATYFNCTNADLLEIKKEPAIDGELSNTKMQLVEWIRNMSETEAVGLLAALNSNRKSR